MIKNMWYPVVSSKEIRKNKPVTVKRLGMNLVIWRKSDGSPCCIEDKCCHRGASFATGKVHGNHIECPFHGFKYNGNGKVVEIPANGKRTKVEARFKVESFLLREKHDFIWFWYGEEEKVNESIPFFKEIEKGFTYAERRDPWPVHYTRAIENQLDVVHLPFVHHNTIGRGGAKLVNGPVVVRKGTSIKFYVDNIVDDGKTIPMKPKEIVDYEKLFQLEFKYPNIWLNKISDKFNIFVAFVPVDEENTLIYLRGYQRFLTIPGISSLVNQLMMIFNLIVLNQDKRVVITQKPIRTQLRMGENLIQGDLPIIEYRKGREAMLNGDYEN